jgi:hypothetical protein
VIDLTGALVPESTLFSVTEGVAVVAALNQAQFEEEAFECAFEMKDAARKVALRNEGAMDGGGKGPMWKQIQEGLAGADGTDG